MSKHKLSITEEEALKEITYMQSSGERITKSKDKRPEGSDPWYEISLGDPNYEIPRESCPQF